MITLKEPAYFKKLFAVAALLSFLDAGTTQYALTTGIGYEANPAAALITSMPILAATGVIATLLVASFTLIQNRLIQTVALALIALKVAVVINNFIQLAP